jgi:hypothetical protein
MVLRGHWCNIIVLNVHAPTEEKSDDSKDSLYEELEQVFDHFPKYHMKILLGDFNAKLGREDTLKPTIGNESLHEDSDDNGVRVLIFATSKNLVVKSTMCNLSAGLTEILIKISAKESLGLYERKHHKPWFDDECSNFLD